MKCSEGSGLKNLTLGWIQKFVVGLKRAESGNDTYIPLTSSNCPNPRLTPSPVERVLNYK